MANKFTMSSTTTVGSVARLSDQDLLDATARIAGDERRTTAELVALLAELDTRRLYLGEGYSSLFTYCTQRLRLSESAAFGRIDTQSQSLAIKSHESRSVVWREGLSVEKESAAFRADILRRHTLLIAWLVRQRLLTQTEAEALPQPRIALTVHDQRGS